MRRLNGAAAVLAGGCLAACAAAAPPPGTGSAAARITAHAPAHGEVEVLVSGRPEAAPSARRAPGQHATSRAPGTPASTAAKGVSAWVFSGVNKALGLSGASWYYTWATSHSGITSPSGVRFVPMIWGAGSVTTANLNQVKHEGPDLLGFNEPDNSGQSNMTVPQALRLWPKLMGTGLTLGSPAVATDAATPGGWLDTFMRGAKARHYRVDFIAVHWYGGDFVTGQAVQQLRGYLQAIHARYGLPIWLTEFALIRFGSTTTFPTAHQQASFVTAATSMLGRLSYVQRYAWFALPATPGDGTAGLFRPGARPTAAGRAFEAAGASG